MKIKIKVTFIHESKREYWSDVPVTDERLEEIIMHHLKEDPSQILDGHDEFTLDEVSLEH